MPDIVTENDISVILLFNSIHFYL